MTSVAFLGSHDLGVACLERLADHPAIEVPVVVTYPPAHEGWWERSVRKRAAELGYPVLSLAEERDLLTYDVDYLLSVYYPNILDAELLDHPREAAINLHQAELPRYRGSNTFTHAIQNARPDDHWRYGTTMHVMVEQVDAGPIIDRRFVEIRPTDTARSLYERTREASIQLFEDTLPTLVSGDVHETVTPQAAFDGKRYFYLKSDIDKEIPLDRLAAATDDDATALAVYDTIRSLDFPPFEPAYTTVGGERVHLTTDGDRFSH
ncbi:methionyl-tRNA formyltransferase [Salinirubrum litoreum]|uniref:Methionyl-tRNA formyltransferase n=1 Tax=Salinirubrum litoreum TaxID=1126234 RepID=A0ABD5RDX8_9EURY|nr:formyltransferase family protein [Salinirubrum litoreum]